MNIDRELQFRILTHLKSIYSIERRCFDTWQVLRSFPGGEDTDNLIANLSYLEEHGLLHSGLKLSVDGIYSHDGAGIRITIKGLDFIQKDGGLSAILNCVTVKIHDDSLTRIERFLAQSSLDPQKKAGYLARLRELPADATKHLLLKLLDAALENTPAALQLIQRALA